LIGDEVITPDSSKFAQRRWVFDKLLGRVKVKPGIRGVAEGGCYAQGSSTFECTQIEGDGKEFIRTRMPQADSSRMRDIKMKKI